MSALLLRALDGSNPLAFLTALGTLRLAHLATQEETARMSWQRANGCWRPVLHGCGSDENALCESLFAASWAPVAALRQLGGNITVPRDSFAPFVRAAQTSALPGDRRLADFAAAFGSECCVDEKKNRIEYTDFCFITGSGHQDFLGTMDQLSANVTESHLADALFGSWRQEKTLSMRWDPQDASEYALQWDDPGPKGASAVWGANRLASEALPLLPAIATRSSLQTTGFRWRARQNEWTWPIWTAPVRVDTVGSLLSLESLQEQNPDRKSLRAMNIEEVYRSQRVRVGQGANFKVSFRQSEAV